MSYPPELCQLVIENLEQTLEGPKVVAYIGKRVFAAINERIKEHLERIGGWEGCYGLVSDEDENETSFKPEAWPKKDEIYVAYYALGYADADEELDWLEIALGRPGQGLWICFHYDHNELGIKHSQYKKEIANFFSKSQLADYGFKYDGLGNIHIPFILDSVVVKEEYPDLDEALRPVDEAMEQLIKAHPIFDEFVKKLVAGKS